MQDNKDTIFFNKYALVKKDIEIHDVDCESIIKKFQSSKFIEILINMIKTRLLDIEISQLIKEGIPINQHSTYGQEGSQVVASSLLRKEDYLVPNHRGWGWAIGKGLDLKKILCELMFKKNGYCKGKGGPHIADREHNLFLRVGIQGSYISLAAGIGLGIKLKKENNICLCLFGDGASNAGYVHEGMNIASVRKLPVVYFCENNMYASLTYYRETTSVKNIADRAIGYNIPGYIVDGMDVFAVIKVVSKAIEWARNNNGPVFIESKTYRYSGHTEFDKFHYGEYRKKEEVEAWKERDPIKFYSEKLIKYGLISKENIKLIEENIQKEIKKAVHYAFNSKFTDREDYLKDVYAKEEVSNNVQ